MIIAHISGGLGNQMFQYAAARALAQQCGTEVKLDTTSFTVDHLRNFDLSQMQAQFAFASEAEINKLKAHTSKERIFQRLLPYAKKKFYKQPFFHFDSLFHTLKDNVYIKGYFQSEKFFDSIAPLIKKEFNVLPEHTEKVATLGAAIRSKNAVSIHIRRGDYKNAVAMQYHGILPLSYYSSAITLIQQKTESKDFYIFTDDTAWVTQNLKVPDATLVSGVLSTTHFEDLFLMSQCRHNIIANSSFSWWGAWLGTAAEKVVIAPKQWFDKGPKDTQDLVPARWLKI